MLDFSLRRELSLHAEVAADVTTALDAMGISGIVVGAFARDLHLHYEAGIPAQRATEDIDFAFAVRSWDEFSGLRERLVNAGSFKTVEGTPQRLRHRSTLSVDLVPFGNIENDDRRIAWPPGGDIVMDVFGFSESFSGAEKVLMPGNVKISIVGLPALALLKIIAWDDRHRRFPGKDAADLNLILRSYLAVPRNQERLWSDFAEWAGSPDFDYELSGARMLGHDIRDLVDTKGLTKVDEILRKQLDAGELPQQMQRQAPKHALALLKSLHAGLSADRA